MITHDVEDVLALAEVCFVYEEGRIVRQVDLRDATQRDVAREAITGLQAQPTSPLRQRLQRMLLGQTD